MVKARKDKKNQAKSIRGTRSVN